MLTHPYLWFKNGIFSYPLLQLDDANRTNRYSAKSFTFNVSTPILNISDKELNEFTFRLFPTQTKNHFTCQYTLPQQSAVIITLINSLRTSVHNLKPYTQLQGEHQEEFQLPSLPSGMYFVDLNINGASNLKKIFITE